MMESLGKCLNCIGMGKSGNNQPQQVLGLIAFIFLQHIILQSKKFKIYH